MKQSTPPNGQPLLHPLGGVFYFSSHKNEGRKRSLHFEIGMDYLLRTMSLRI